MTSKAINQQIADWVFVQQQKSECAKVLEKWLHYDLDSSKSIDENYESFLECTSQLGFDMPVDSSNYFDFRNECYNCIEFFLTDSAR